MAKKKSASPAKQAFRVVIDGCHLEARVIEADSEAEAVAAYKAMAGIRQTKRRVQVAPVTPDAESTPEPPAPEQPVTPDADNAPEPAEAT